MTTKYELALVISAKLDDDTRAAVLEKAKNYITRFGGTVGETEEWGKRKLAYEIQKVTEAYYYFIQFTSDDSDTPNQLEGRMRIMDNVLRYLVVRKDNDTFSVAPEKTEAPAKEEAPKEEAPAEESKEQAPAEEAAAEAPAEQ
jgi:small subunit ribosomal protein S6